MPSSLLDPENTFASLADSVGLDNRLRKAVARLGHVRPTLVQSKCLPLAISSGRDLLVRARTGSGKTLAYCLPLLQKILQSKQKPDAPDCVRAVVLVPTRELCSQVHRTLQSLVYYCDDVISVAVLSASCGRSEQAKREMTRQEAMLRDRPDVVVATPAGLLTHIRSGALHLKTSVETLVVDEADLVLSCGYADDISEITKSLPKICQGYLMSATLSPELNSLKRVVLHSPAVLKLEQDEADGKRQGQLMQFYVALPKKDKNLVLYVFLKLGLLKGKGLFFVNTIDRGYRLKLFLEQFSIRSAVLNAELPFRSRLNIIEQFNVGNFDYLIATDDSTDAVESDEESDSSDGEDEAEGGTKRSKKRDKEYGVSRGMDFRNVSFVVNVDFPPSPKAYSHRIGRTARGGSKGVALSLIESESHEQADLLASVQEDQPRISKAGFDNDFLQSVAMEGDSEETQPQPTPLDFDLSEIEGFRYRVEDVSRAVTRTAVRETRAAEIRAEILNSDRLQSHFDDNPVDLQLLRHDRVATHVSKVQEHLKHVPKYLLPQGMQVANLNKKRKRKHKNRGTGGQRRSDNDPLRSFDGADLGLEGLVDDDEDAGSAMAEEERKSKRKKTDSERKIFSSTRDGLGESTAGRNAWKQKHGKGKFSGKKRKSERKRRQPLGI